MGIETSKHASTFLPKTMDFGTLENMLQEPSVTPPICLPIEFLKAITRDFSEEQELGRGGYGVVYKGILQNGKMIAVKKLFDIQVDDDQFHKEVTHLIGVKHENIVQLVGYCAESRWEATQVSGRYVLAEIRKRLLCFEYLQNNSLDKHLSAESCGLEWHVRYGIIRGVCCGLHYLHEECRIVHLDLKPENILLDGNMVPKLADFGMSRLFGQQQSRIITDSRGGTLGYMPPEYLTNGVISTKSDIFSLGVIIIELMTGRRDYPQSSETPFELFIENVTGNWRQRLGRAWEICAQQVNRCIMLGLDCVNPDPKKRPSAWDIIQKLNELESMNGCFDKNEGPTLGQEPQVVTILGSGNVNSSSSQSSFDKILGTRLTSTSANITTIFRSAPKGRMISILAFEVVNTIVKASSLMKSLSEQRIRNLKEGVLRSEGARRLISEDYSQLSILIEVDIREDLRQFSLEVSRFGNHCKDPTWHNLERLLRCGCRINSAEAAPPNMPYLIKLARVTTELHQELLRLDIQYNNAVKVFSRLCRDDREEMLALSRLKKQLGAVKVLKKRSLWCKNMEDIVEKLVEIVLFMHLEINRAFVKNHGEQREKVTANNLGKTLGRAGLALHYANVILQIKNLALASPAIPDKAREALYQALPPGIKPMLRIQLGRRCASREKMTTVAEVRAEMDRVLQWLAPAAESTRLYYMNGVFGEWTMRGMEGIDVDEHNWFEQDSRISIPSMISHVDAKLSKVETLYHANIERTEGYILDLVLALHRLCFAYKLVQGSVCIS